MKKINYKILLVTCIVTLFPIALGLVFYDSLPNEMAVHFNIKNNPDNYRILLWDYLNIQLY